MTSIQIVDNLIHTNRRIAHMATVLETLTANVASLSAAVDTLIAAKNDTTQLQALADQVAAETAKVQAALTPVA
jgi:hypothetical protein